MTTPVKVSTFFVQNEEQNDAIDSLRRVTPQMKNDKFISSVLH